ncbi:hypothetical protein M3Y99_01587700 [Aphelenchoides fujianensis]|nr:hypothetical protein M3Y99_01587700 [Aphelenchoides fujianensis]
MADKPLRAPTNEADGEDDWEMVPSAESVTSTILSTTKWLAWDFGFAAFCVALLYIGVPFWLHGATFFVWRPTHLIRWAWRRFCFSFLWKQTKRIQY